MRKRKSGENGYKTAIIAGFAALYLVCMIFMTYMVKSNYENMYRTQAGDVREQIIETIDKAGITYEEDGSLSPYSVAMLQYILSNNTSYSDKYSMLSVGIYDKNGTLIAQTADNFSLMMSIANDEDEGKAEFASINISDYFTEEEIEEIRSYYEEAGKLDLEGSNKSYGCKVFFDTDAGEIVNLAIKETELREENGGWTQVYLNTVFQWRNEEYPPFKSFETMRYAQIGGDITECFYFPYLKYGRNYYDKWKNDAHLQTFDCFKEQDQDFDATDYYIDTVIRKDTYSYHDSIYVNAYVEDLENWDFTLRVNQRLYQWHAAADYLQNIYIYGFILMVVCMAVVLRSTGKTYKQQAQLEETRRDFTNAIAHELKTPLSIIRGLAENLDEETSGEMRSYYTNQIVNQTEVMDSMVKEMIFTSRLDSDELKLRKEPVSVCQMVEEQLRKLEPLIEEKNLMVQVLNSSDLMINGDRAYLEKMMLNLLENGIVYNKEGGGLIITIEKDKCTIENTADSIPEEDLPHLCDMFFTGNKSRTSGMKHMGLGLYLVKKICTLHQLNFEISNSELGVMVTITT